MYNVAGFARAAAESVLSQAWTDLELIAIDDGSNDGSSGMVKAIPDSRVRAMCQGHRGVAAARNIGLNCARGRYIAFMDADDLWLPGKLGEDITFLESHPGADLVFSAMRMVDETGREIGRTVRRWSGVLTLRDLLIENMIGTDTVLMRREAVQRTGWFDETLLSGSDYDYWLRVALLRPENLYGSPRVTALYRRRPDQLTGDWARQLEVWQKIIGKMRALRPELLSEVETLAAAGLHRALAATAYENGELDPALRLFGQAMRAAPGFLLGDRRTWLLGSALLSARVLPRRAHETLEKFARTARASRP